MLCSKSLHWSFDVICVFSEKALCCGKKAICRGKKAKKNNTTPLFTLVRIKLFGIWNSCVGHLECTMLSQTVKIKKDKK